MNQSSACEQRLRDLLGTDLSASELRRLAHADAQLRLTAAHDRDQAARAMHNPTSEQMDVEHLAVPC